MADIPKRRPGRPTTPTGTPPVRTTRQGPVWDAAVAVARMRGETVHAVIGRALARYVRRYESGKETERGD